MLGKKLFIFGTTLTTLAFGSIAFAENITIYFTAEVDSLSDTGNLLGGAVNTGDIISGEYTYESTTPDSNSLPEVGDYWHDSAPYGIEVNVGEFTFQTDPDNVHFLVEIVNDAPNAAGIYDAYVVNSYNNLPLSDGTVVNMISWNLIDLSATALSTVSLPTTPPNLTDWGPLNEMSITAYNCEHWDGSYCSPEYDQELLLYAHVTSVSLEPPSEPTIVDELKDYIVELPDDAFIDNPDQLRNALLNKVNAVNNMIEECNSQEAIDKLLNDIAAKADGYLAGDPNNDWITNPDIQAELDQLIEEVIADIESNPLCNAPRYCSEVATEWCESKGWTVVSNPDPSIGNIVCTRIGQGSEQNCLDCGDYNIIVWEDGSPEQYCPGTYTTLAGIVYAGHIPCECADNLMTCQYWDMQDCIPDAH